MIDGEIWIDINYNYQMSSLKTIRRIEEDGSINIVATHFKKGNEYVCIIDENNCSVEYLVHKIFNILFKNYKPPRRKYLTSDVVDSIRADYKSGEFNQAQLSRKYKIKMGSIHLIVKEKSYMGN